MSPIRKEIVKGHVIEEYYWTGELVTYVDNILFKGTFEEAIKYFKEI